MEQKKNINFKAIYAILVAIVLLLSGGLATYAWYSSNKTVDTNTLTARTSSDNIGIQMSSDGIHFVDAGGVNGTGMGTGDNGAGGNGAGGNGGYGATPAKGNQVAIKQMNAADLGFLLPVSTADLKSFVTNDITVEGMAKDFTLVQNEDRYYHGRVYLRAVAENQPENLGMDVYLDEQLSAGGALITNASDELINASRLGITVNGGSPIILRMTEDKADAANQIRNTYIDGRVLADGEVLGYNAGKAYAAKDPSELISTYAVKSINGTITLPSKKLMKLELNKIYTIDIYYYLEGCDPDCSDKVALENFDMHLAFYGVLN